MKISAPIKSLIAIASLFACVLSTASYADDAQTLDNKVTALTKAMIDADGKALKALSSPALSYGHSGGHIENQAEFIEKITSGKSDFVTINVSEQTINVSGDTAIVRHILNANINDGGVPGTIKLGVLLVWQKQNGDWKLLARQAFKFPPPVTQ
ncbi:MAG TPA: nuclear transport factor 2 family protein [Cellvibrio sp.]